MESNTTIQNVSDTAIMAAAYRAVESLRPDALFHDRLAEKLIGERGRGIIASLPKGAFVGGWTVVIRTFVIDLLIKKAIDDGIDMIVNLGAGLDTRPYRMDLPPSLTWIEIDLPQIIDFKEGKLSGDRPNCILERKGVDLNDTQKRQELLTTITKRSKNILVLTEAVTPYLKEDEVASLGKDLRKHPEIKYWVVDYFSPEAHQYRKRSGMNRSMKNAPFLFEPENYFDFFLKINWSAKEVHYLAETAESLKRPPPFPSMIKMITKIASFFVSSEKRIKMKRYTGIVLFKPIE